MTIQRNNQDWRQPINIKNRPNRHKYSGGRININSSYKQPKKRKKKIVKKLISILIPVCILLFLIGGISFLGMLAWVSKDLPSPDKVINREITVSTKIYDKTGEVVLYDIHGDIKRTLIELDQIPEYAINATLAAEDRNFYHHKGFSITGIIRSVIKNALTGSRVGGSTLTQQFVKNAVLTTEKSYIRKIKELLISYKLEKEFEKDEILKMYFNEIPYGSVIYGIEAASQTFFGKSAKDLSIAESAILASIPQLPTYYSPYGSNKDRLFIRQRWVIDSMKELGYITSEQAEQARNEKIIFKPLTESILAPHFVMYVRELLAEKYGEEFITQEGLKVYTSLDLDKQKIAEQAVKDGVEKNSEKYGFTNASLVAIDPETGQILAMVGSVDYFNDEIDGQVNVSLRNRQPGSSFKPIVYTAAFKKGYTPDTILYDVITDFNTTQDEEEKYEPKNYDLKEHGPITIRKALQGSLNIPAVKATYLTGMDDVLDLADDLGYTTLEDRNRFGLSIVLGGAEVKLLEHVNAYAVLAQEGIKHEINPILKIEDKNGRVLYEYKDKKKKVLDKQYARLITNVLSDDQAREYVFGPGSYLTLKGRQASAKTGTTNDYRDAWTVGYTPNLAAGVWVGNNDNTEMAKGASGGRVASPIWNQFMTEALKETEPENFNKPEPIETDKPVLNGVETGEQKIAIDTMSGKLATEYTPDATKKELSLKEVHNILYYINKDDPQGDPLKNPKSDTQYKNWEEAVIKWAEDQGFDPNVDIEIPTDYDDIHLKKDQPHLTIITPWNNQKITEENINIEIQASAPRGIQTVEYYLNDKKVLTHSDTRDANLDITHLNNSFHTLTVKVLDDLKNTASKSIELNIQLPRVVPTLNWSEPKNNSEIILPLTLKANLSNQADIKKIDFYYMKEGSGQDKYITTGNPSDGQISFVLDKDLKPGTYEVYGNIFTIDDHKYTSEKIKIIVPEPPE